jgi:hypothetical protein
MTRSGQPRADVIQSVAYPTCDAARVYAAAFEAVSTLGSFITARDDAATTLGFRPATPTGSWPHEQMTATVLAEGSGARIVFSGAPSSGAWLQMGQWREGQAIALMVLDRMKSVLATT